MTMPHVTEVTVRYAETDCMGVVHHAVYPIWFEIARTDYIKAAGMSYSDMEKGGVMLPVTGISCRYRAPAKYDDVIAITAKITRLTPARIEFSYEAVNARSGALLCTGTSSHGFVDAQTFRPLNMANKMPELFRMMAENARLDEEDA